MYNIKFRGIYENEKQLQKNEILDTSVRFKEPENINKFMLKATIISLPMVMGVIAIAGFALYDTLMKLQNHLKMKLIFSMVVSGFIIIISLFTHEIIDSWQYISDNRSC